MQAGAITQFIEKHYRHFNAGVLRAAASAWKALLGNDGKMFLSLAGAMSTAELGVSLAEMIRRQKIHAICCTGANLEEDVFNLIAHHHYVPVPHYRHLAPEDEERLLKQKLNRVTDTCIPETEAMRRVEGLFLEEIRGVEKAGHRVFPHEVLYQLLKSSVLRSSYQIDPSHSWLLAAAERNLPLFVPGWEDSTLGNMFAAHCMTGKVKQPHTIRTGIEYMIALADWYQAAARPRTGFFQIGGGIAGDFPICVVPLLQQDMKINGIPRWAYFCQISDSTTSYGSYSGAVPNEKITWGKLETDTPKFIIESDATIVAPLIFAYVLGW